MSGTTDQGTMTAAEADAIEVRERLENQKREKSALAIQRSVRQFFARQSIRDKRLWNLMQDIDEEDLELMTFAAVTVTRFFRRIVRRKRFLERLSQLAVNALKPHLQLQPANGGEQAEDAPRAPGGLKLIVMGSSGCGKSTVAAEVASILGIPCLDADDYHTPENKEKMRKGVPLTDEDRWPWLHAVGENMRRFDDCVLACSALKRRYRAYLRGEYAPEGTDALAPVIQIAVVQLEVPAYLLQRRLEARKTHFAGPLLISSQLTALEPPPLRIPVIEQDSVRSCVVKVLDGLRRCPQDALRQERNLLLRIQSDAGAAEMDDSLLNSSEPLLPFPHCHPLIEPLRKHYEASLLGASSASDPVVEVGKTPTGFVAAATTLSPQFMRQLREVNTEFAEEGPYHLFPSTYTLKSLSFEGLEHDHRCSIEVGELVARCIKIEWRCAAEHLMEVFNLILEEILKEEGIARGKIEERIRRRRAAQRGDTSQSPYSIRTPRPPSADQSGASGSRSQRRTKDEERFYAEAKALTQEFNHVSPSSVLSLSDIQGVDALVSPSPGQGGESRKGNEPSPGNSTPQPKGTALFSSSPSTASPSTRYSQIRSLPVVASSPLQRLLQEQREASKVTPAPPSLGVPGWNPTKPIEVVNGAKEPNPKHDAIEARSGTLVPPEEKKSPQSKESPSRSSPVQLTITAEPPSKPQQPSSGRPGSSRLTRPSSSSPRRTLDHQRLEGAGLSYTPCSTQCAPLTAEEVDMFDTICSPRESGSHEDLVASGQSPGKVPLHPFSNRTVEPILSGWTLRQLDDLAYPANCCSLRRMWRGLYDIQLENAVEAVQQKRRLQQQLNGEEVPNGANALVVVDTAPTGASATAAEKQRVEVPSEEAIFWDSFRTARLTAELMAVCPADVWSALREGHEENLKATQPSHFPKRSVVAAHIVRRMLDAHKIASRLETGEGVAGRICLNLFLLAKRFYSLTQFGTSLDLPKAFVTKELKRIDEEDTDYCDGGVEDASQTEASSNKVPTVVRWYEAIVRRHGSSIRDLEYAISVALYENLPNLFHRQSEYYSEKVVFRLRHLLDSVTVAELKDFCQQKFLRSSGDAVHGEPHLERCAYAVCQLFGIPIDPAYEMEAESKGEQNPRAPVGSIAALKGYIESHRSPDSMFMAITGGSASARGEGHLAEVVCFSAPRKNVQAILDCGVTLDDCDAAGSLINGSFKALSEYAVRVSFGAADLFQIQ